MRARNFCRRLATAFVSYVHHCSRGDNAFHELAWHRGDCIYIHTSACKVNYLFMITNKIGKIVFKRL